MARVKGIPLKKHLGQHFLRAQWVVDEMLDRVNLDSNTSVFEIGCGDGFLTRSILAFDIARLWVFEIDHDWAAYVKEEFSCERLSVFEENILDVDWQRFAPHAPWTLLSNLPYQISFPILHLIVKNRDKIDEGVIMVQEEVAQKITKKSGRGYGFPSLYFQHYLEWEIMSKIPPGSFVPPPKVFSRLLYFKPRLMMDDIPQIEEFWQFIKICFRFPRRTLRNNLIQAHYNISHIDSDILQKRAQQMSKKELLHLWQMILVD